MDNLCSNVNQLSILLLGILLLGFASAEVSNLSLVDVDISPSWINGSSYNMTIKTFDYFGEPYEISTIKVSDNLTYEDLDFAIIRENVGYYVVEFEEFSFEDEIIQINLDVIHNNNSNPKSLNIKITKSPIFGDVNTNFFNKGGQVTEWVIENRLEVGFSIIFVLVVVLILAMLKYILGLKQNG